MSGTNGSLLTRRRVAALVAALAAAYAAAGAVWIRHQSGVVRREQFADLAAIGTLKVDQIARWRAERLGDAGVLADDAALAADVAELLRDPGSAAGARVRARLGSLCERYGYADAQVVTTDGRIVLRVAPADGEHDEGRAAVARAIRERAPVLTSVHRHGADAPHTGVAAPVGPALAPGSVPLAAVLLLSDARTFLFPLIQTWPVPSGSAETLLVERRGDEVVFLNDLRFRPGTALALRMHVTDTEVPAVQAALGRTGSFEGLDYRGVPVLADLRPVPGSPWFAVSKVDRAELLAPLAMQTLAVMLGVVALATITGLGIAVIYKAQGKAAFAARYRAERERREALEELKTTLHSIGDAVIATDRTGRVTLMNAVAELLTGWSEAEASGRPLADVFRIVNEETRLPVEDPVAKVLREGTIVGLANHTVLIARDGSERPIADSGAPVRDEDGDITGVVLVFRDQSTERAAQRESSLLTSTIRAARDEIYLFDADTLRFRFVNDGALRNLGYTATEIAGLTPVDIKPEFTLGQFVAAVAPLRDGSQQFLRFETVHARKDGSRYPVEVHLQLLDVLGDRVFLAVIQDISERRQALAALTESEGRFRTFFESAPIGKVITAPDGTLMRVNPALRAMLGYSEAELRQRTWAAITHPDDLPESRECVRSLLAGEAESWSMEKRYVHRDGHPVPTLVTTRLLRDGSGTPLYFITHVLDIGARKRAEEAAHRTNRALRTLSECNQALVRARDEATLLHEVCRHIVEQGGYRMAWVGLALDDAARTVHPVAVAGAAAGYVEQAKISWAAGERGMGPTGTAIRERRTVIARDLATEPAYGPWREAALARGFASSIALPLLDGGTCLGALSIYAAGVDAFDTDEVGLLSELATDIAFGLRTLRDRDARAAAERALAESEERLRLALAAARQGIYDLDVRTGEAIVSDEYATMLGYDPAQFRETNDAWIARLHPDDREAVAAVYRAYIAGESPEYRVEFRQRTRAGAWKWILSVGKVVERDERGRPLRMLGTHTDIDAEKTAEHAAREGEERFSAAFHNSPIAMALTSVADGTYRDVNDVFLRDSGYGREEVIGRTSGELALFARPQDRDRLIAGVIEHGRVYGMPCTIRAKDGVLRETLISTCRITVAGDRFFLSAILDVSELKRAEEALRASRSELQAISDGAPVMICVVDSKRRVLAGNRAFREASGWPGSELVSDRACGVLGCINALDSADGCGYGPHCDGCRLRRAILETLSSGQARRDVECEITLLRHGASRETVVLASTTPFELGGELRLVLCLVDITERRALEARLRQAQRMEAVGTLAGGIAHDFNNLLQALLSSTQAARLQAREPVVVAALDEVQAQVRRGAALTRQLLLFARQAPAQHEPLDLGALVGEQAAMLRRLLPENVVLAVEPCAEPLAVAGDAGQLGQVLTNLVVNARDALPDGGRIAVALRRDGDHAMVEVSDTGSGIPAEVRDRIFDPFFSTKPQGKGTGLGLAVVWGIVKDHAGQIEVASDPGRGTTFSIRLPLSQAGLAAAVEPEREALPAGRGERVLLIEDEDGAREGLAELLAALGYRVVAVASAEAAYEELPVQPFDLLLTDFRLPGASGLDLARGLRAARPELRIVIMSGYAPSDLNAELFADGAAHFLQKPFDMAALAQALRDALAAPPRPLA